VNAVVLQHERREQYGLVRGEVEDADANADAECDVVKDIYLGEVAIENRPEMLATPVRDKVRLAADLSDGELLPR